MHTKLHLLQKDVLSEDRAIGDASSADKSNFLHPVLYCYSEPIDGRPWLVCDVCSINCMAYDYSSNSHLYYIRIATYASKNNYQMARQ